MVTVIVPGCHTPDLTDGFLLGLPKHPAVMWIPPQQSYWPAYSPQHLCWFLQQCLEEEHRVANPPPPRSPLLLIGFSAGVVASMGAIQWWQSQGGEVKACIAVDGWGVPLGGGFPIHRLSHDRWTHFSSHLLGGTDVGFYANPGVDHLELWRSPQTTMGISTTVPNLRGNPLLPTSDPAVDKPITAAQFIHRLLQWYGEVPEP
jgi:hypothetical protein